MPTIAQRLQTLKSAIQQAQQSSPYGQQVSLLAVSKAQSADTIREAFLCGQTLFGENYLQEALNKQAMLTELPIEWHFIGPIQSNKTQAIAQHFAWVHSIDRTKIAQRLNDARPDDLPPLQVCIQLNVSDETTKSGTGTQDLEALAMSISALPKLQLRGLMAIPAPTQDIGKQRAQFTQVRECFDALNTKGFALDTLSIGMSEDYPVAISQGATIVRIGTALFGTRPKKNNALIEAP